MIFNNSPDNENDDIFQARSRDEIDDALGEMLDKVWYNRHMELRELVESGEEQVDAQIWRDALKAAKKIEDKYGVDNLGPWDDFEWGMINGKLSALRWVLGDDWDNLDT